MKKRETIKTKDLLNFIGLLDGIIKEQNNKINNLSLEIERLKESKGAILHLIDFKETKILN